MYLSSFSAAVLGKPQFRVDPVVPVSYRDEELPNGEVLFSLPNGVSAENFFSDMRRHIGFLIRNDITILRAALDYADKTGKIMSVNANVETVFSKEFEELMAERHAQGKPRHWKEITEHGGVPDNADPARLKYLHKKYGVKFFLDDLDPSQSETYQRLEALGDNVQGLKFAHQVWHRIRKNLESSEVEFIRKICEAYSGCVITMEGVTERDQPLLPYMQGIGITAMQMYHPVKMQQYAPEATSATELAPAA